MHRNGNIGAFFQNGNRARLEPAAVGSSRKRLLTQPLAIRRIGKQHVERLEIADAAEIGRVTAQHARAAMQAERIDVFPEKRPALDAVFDEERMAAAARDGFETDCAGAGKEIEDLSRGLKAAEKAMEKGGKQ